MFHSALFFPLHNAKRFPTFPHPLPRPNFSPPPSSPPPPLSEYFNTLSIQRPIEKFQFDLDSIHNSPLKFGVS